MSSCDEPFLSLERDVPTIELIDVEPAAARDAIASLAGPRPRSVVDDLLLAVSEVVTNAHRHGVPPVHLRAWEGSERLLVTVSDAGRGPDQPLAQLVTAGGPDQESGRGLWLAHRMAHVSHEVGRDGYTVRLVSRAPGCTTRRPVTRSTSMRTQND